MKVTKQADIVAGLKRLGLHVEVTGTKVKEWKRIHVHQVLRERTEEQIPMMQYIAKISIHNGMLHTYTFKGLPNYYAYAIKLMLDQGKLLNHINFLSLGVKASNETLYLKKRAEKETDNKLKHKAMLQYHWEKQKLFTSLFTERYYGGVQPSRENLHYAL